MGDTSYKHNIKINNFKLIFDYVRHRVTKNEADKIYLVTEFWHLYSYFFDKTRLFCKGCLIYCCCTKVCQERIIEISEEIIEDYIERGIVNEQRRRNRTI